MKHHLSKINTLTNSANDIFEGALGYQLGRRPGDKRVGMQISTGNLDNGLLYASEFLEINPDESAVFANHSFIKNIVTGWSTLTNLNLTDKNNKWILNSKFDIENASIRDGKINFSSGKWIKGAFGGGRMHNIDFDGGFFNGEVFDSGKWNIHPFGFIDGKWSVSGSILGLNDIKSFNQKAFKFNIIAVVPGNKIAIDTEDGKTYEIHVIKRLDSRSSSFQYKVKFPGDDTMHSIEVAWSMIRGAKSSEFNKNTILSNSNIPNIFISEFGFKINSPIVKVRVDPSSVPSEKIEEPEKEKTEKELSQTQQHYDLSNAPFLRISKLSDPKDEYWNEKGIKVKNNVGRVFLNAPDPKYLGQLKNVITNLNNGVISADFTKLKSWMDAGVINGAPENYLWLANLIGLDKTKRTIEDENFLGSLNRIEAFLKYFVGMIVEYAGKSNRERGLTNTPNERVRNLIKSNLRSILGLESKEGSQKKTPQKTQGKSLPGIQAEGVRSAIRNIILGNLKHF